SGENAGEAVFEDLVARANGVGSAACSFGNEFTLIRQNADVTLRNAACLATGDAAMGLSTGVFQGSTSLRLRNVTATAVGQSARGTVFFAQAERFSPAFPSVVVDALGVVAEGNAADIEAYEWNEQPEAPAPVAVEVDLRHSAYG